MREIQKIMENLNKNIVDLESKRIKAEKSGDMASEINLYNRRKNLEEIRDEIAVGADEELIKKAELIIEEFEKERNSICEKIIVIEKEVNKNIDYLTREISSIRGEKDVKNKNILLEKRKELMEINAKISLGMIDNETIQKAEKINMEINKEKPTKMIKKVISVIGYILLLILMLILEALIKNKLNSIR